MNKIWKYKDFVKMSDKSMNKSLIPESYSNIFRE